MEIYWEISDPTIFTESRNFMEVFLTLLDGSNCSMGFRFVCDLIYLFWTQITENPRIFKNVENQSDMSVVVDVATFCRQYY